MNWTIIGHALKRQPPFEHFEKTQHGNGVWAPSIRYHNNEFYIYYPDPDFGIYVVKAKRMLLAVERTGAGGRWQRVD